MKSNQRKVDDLCVVYIKYLQTLDLPDVRSLIGYVRSRNWAGLFRSLEGSMAQQKYESSTSYYEYASAYAFIAKNPLLAGSHCEVNALSSWYAAERACKRANRRIVLTTRTVLSVGSQYRNVLERARRKILAIIGDSPKWLFTGRHGPGASVGCSGIATSAPFKDAALPYAVTNSCFNYFTGQLSFSESWLRSLRPSYDGGEMPASDWFSLLSESVKVVEDTNKLAFVPKNWKTSRTIGVEPLGNMYIQLALGDELALYLRRVGIDIRDQSKNQELARLASLHTRPYGDDYVTLDLSMASDTLCRELVRFLLPPAWYVALDSARCQSTRLPNGSLVRLQKFSSMGNGFTFPLETLIFFALAYCAVGETCHRSKILAYGDDIVVPRGSALYVCEVFRWCGFSVNSQKSCIFGDFYESCGTDYLRGNLVRPFYFKRSLDTVRDYYYILNMVRRHRKYISYSAASSDFYNHLISKCGRNLLFGPVPSLDESARLIDTHIHTNEPSLLKFRRCKDLHQLQYKRYVDKPRQRYLDERFAVIDRLRRPGKTSQDYLRRVFDNDISAIKLDISISDSKVRWVTHNGLPTHPDEIDSLIKRMVTAL